MSAYDEAMVTVRDNKAAMALLRDSAHHTVNCQRGREADKNWDVCWCDLPVHLAEIIREATAPSW
jgi:hypothetical protein